MYPEAHQVEPFLFQLIHDDLKYLIADIPSLFLLPLCVDGIEPCLIYSSSAPAIHVEARDLPCSSISYST
jgi:hypothetical protein